MEQQSDARLAATEVAEILAQQSSSSSDEEERMWDSRAAIPREVYKVRRRAALVLTMSGVLFLLSVGIFLPTELAGKYSDAAAAVAAVGYSEQLEQLQQHDGEIRYDVGPTPYRLVVASLLRSTSSAEGQAISELSAGVQVFPLARDGDWIHVLVPRHQPQVTRTSVNAPFFGWLPEKVENGGSKMLLLEPDTEFSALKRQQRSGLPQRSDEEVALKWSEVRAKNAKLKAKLAEFHASMQVGYASGARAERARGIQATGASMAEVINVQELSKTADDLQKQLKQPSHLMGKIRSLLGR